MSGITKYFCFPLFRLQALESAAHDLYTLLDGVFTDMKTDWQAIRESEAWVLMVLSSGRVFSHIAGHTGRAAD